MIAPPQSILGPLAPAGSRDGVA